MDSLSFIIVLPYLIPAIASITTGVIVWLLMRSRVQNAADQARNENLSQVAVLSSQLEGLKEETQRLQSLCSDWERKSLDSRDLLETARKDAAQYSERAARVPALENQYSETLAQLAVAQDEISRTAAQLGERTQALEALSKRVISAEAAQQEERQRMESIQTQLRQEASKSATLAEQAARIPELEQTLLVHAEAQKQANHEIANLREKTGSSEALIGKLNQQTIELTEARDVLASKRDQLLQEQQTLSGRIAELTTILDAERNQNAEKLVLLNDAKEALSNQFKTLANEILEEKSKRFTEQNQTNIKQLLDPLKTKLTEFQGKVEEVYINEGKERSALGEQVKHLMTLNQQLSQDAHNLTSALKGQAKTQGNWGEMILERILESSGLRKGHEYVVQECHTTEEGARLLPDVVINLPEERHVIIDSKVSLNAYEEYVCAETESSQAAALQRHLVSLNGHIKGLSEKGYQKLYGLKSQDWVIMFVPIEPAYILAMTHDSRLGQIAWERNVMLVCPSMLMFVLRTVSQLWRQEQQSQNVQEIAKRGEELYDKFVGFVGDLELLGDRLKQAQKAYDGAHGKLKSGKGNLVGQAEKLRKLGLKPSKKLPKELLGFDDVGGVDAEETVAETV